MIRQGIQPHVTEQRFSAREVLARHPNLTDDHLRYLRRCGLVHPVSRPGGTASYGFADLGVLRQVSAALAAERSFQGIVRELLADSAGQLALDFQAETAPARVLQLPPRKAPVNLPGAAAASLNADATLRARLAEEAFLAGSALDDGDEIHQEEAARRYRDALRHDPSLAPALVNLGNIHYTRGALVEAEMLYERAIALTPASFEAHFNLGNTLHDLGRLDDACLAYMDAIAVNPGCADAYFYLAVTLERLGRSADARPYWRTYMEVAPDGEWVELAREFSE
jgi:tetratricopeptide (TPR) repeat protein